MHTKNYYGVVAITEASSGMGAAIARQIAPQAKALILVGRNKDKLIKVKTEISAAHPKMLVHPIICDLIHVDHRKRLIDDLSKLKLDTFVINAEPGVSKKFTDVRFIDHMRTIDTHITANLDLMYQLLPTFDPKVRIQVIVASTPPADGIKSAVDDATKTFLSQWTQDLAAELSSTQMRFSVIQAKTTETALDTPAVAQKCIQWLEQPGTHYLSRYDQVMASLVRVFSRIVGLFFA